MPPADTRTTIEILQDAALAYGTLASMVQLYQERAGAALDRARQLDEAPQVDAAALRAQLAEAEAQGRTWRDERDACEPEMVNLRRQLAEVTAQAQRQGDTLFGELAKEQRRVVVAERARDRAVEALKTVRLECVGVPGVLSHALFKVADAAICDLSANPPVAPDSSSAGPDHNRIHPCASCGVMRSKAEGGTTFTVCDECFGKPRPTTPLPPPDPLLCAAWRWLSDQGGSLDGRRPQWYIAARDRYGAVALLKGAK